MHRGLHYLANAATEAYEAARETVRALPQRRLARGDRLHPQRRPRRSTSSPRRFGRERIGAGDEIVLCVMEHHSNIVPWHFHRERKGAVLRWVDVGDDGSFSLEAFETRT